ncbi:hypothetical protein QOT17_021790 [Balamuthia mandrillaris]
MAEYKKEGGSACSFMHSPIGTNDIQQKLVPVGVVRRGEVLLDAQPLVDVMEQLAGELPAMVAK